MVADHHAPDTQLGRRAPAGVSPHSGGSGDGVRAGVRASGRASMTAPDGRLWGRTRLTAGVPRAKIDLMRADQLFATTPATALRGDTGRGVQARAALPPQRTGWVPSCALAGSCPREGELAG